MKAEEEKRKGLEASLQIGRDERRAAEKRFKEVEKRLARAEADLKQAQGAMREQRSELEKQQQAVRSLEEKLDTSRREASEWEEASKRVTTEHAALVRDLGVQSLDEVKTLASWGQQLSLGSDSASGSTSTPEKRRRVEEDGEPRYVGQHSRSCQHYVWGWTSTDCRPLPPTVATEGARLSPLANVLSGTILLPSRPWQAHSLGGQSEGGQA